MALETVGFLPKVEYHIMRYFDIQTVVFTLRDIVGNRPKKCCIDDN